jgi:hypothetical protein
VYSFLVARIKPEESYEWFTYNGKKPVMLNFRGKPVTLERGQRFGVRPSTSERDIRLVFKGEPTRVFTLNLKQAKDLAKGVKPEGR